MKHNFSIFLHIAHRQEAIDLGVRCESEFELFTSNFEAFIAILTFLQFERFKINSFHFIYFQVKSQSHPHEADISSKHFQ